jgi:hypothetical protein
MAHSDTPLNEWLTNQVKEQLATPIGGEGDEGKKDRYFRRGRSEVDDEFGCGVSPA